MEVSHLNLYVIRRQLSSVWREAHSRGLQVQTVLSIRCLLHLIRDKYLLCLPSVITSHSRGFSPVLNPHVCSPMGKWSLAKAGPHSTKSLEFLFNLAQSSLLKFQAFLVFYPKQTPAAKSVMNVTLV